MSTNSRIAILFLLLTKTNAFAQEMTLEQAAMKSNSPVSDARLLITQNDSRLKISC
jgi:hypothetical protein